MEFLKLYIQNFMSIRSAEIELANQGLTLIQGKNNDDPAFDSNGAGKSTIFEALNYALFDRTIRGLKSDEVVNNVINKNCQIVLDLKDDNGVPYRVSRYRKHNEHKNNVYVFRDGKNITPKSSKDTNKFIEELIQMDFDTFTNSILFGQGLIKMFSVASDGEKKSILEKMLNMVVFKDAQDEAKSKLSEKKDAISKLDTDKIKVAHLIEEVEGTIASLKDSEREHATNTNREIKRLSEELKRAEEQYEEESTSNDEYEERLTKLKSMKDTLDKKLANFSKYEEARSSLTSDLQYLLKEKHRNESEIDKLKREAEKIKAGEGTNCPACGQVISEETTEKALEHVTEKLRELLTEKQSANKELLEKKNDLEKLDKYLEGKAKVTEQRDVIVGEFSEVLALIKTRDRIREEIESRVANLKKSIQRLEGELEKTYKPMIQEKEKQLLDLNEQLVKIEEQRASLVKEAELIEFWVQAFGNSGIKSYLLDSVTPFLNKRANYYLSKLAGNTTEIEFSTQTRLKSGEVREKFEVRINNLVGGTSYESNSSGEKRRIDLAIALALQDLVMSRSNGKFNILLYDEIFDSLDTVGCESAIQLLGEIQKVVSTIFVITHNETLKSYFDRYLTVSKEGGMTTISREG